jgi:hypothetical protein
MLLDPRCSSVRNQNYYIIHRSLIPFLRDICFNEYRLVNSKENERDYFKSLEPGSDFRVLKGRNSFFLFMTTTLLI